MGEFSAVELWVYRGLVGIAFIFLWWVAKKAYDGLMNKFNSLNDSIKATNITITAINTAMTLADTRVAEAMSQIHIRDERFANMMKLIEVHDKRLDEHSFLIRNIEYSVCDKEDCPIAIKKKRPTVRRTKA